MIGHNAPPPIEAHSLHIEELFSTVSGSIASPVTTDAQEEALDSLLDELKQAKGAASDQCEAEYRPHKTAADGVKSAWKPVLARADAGIDALHRALSPYRIAKEAAREAEAQRLRDIAAAEAAKAQEALAKADDLEAVYEAEAKLETVTKLERMATAATKGPTGLRTSWEAEITDPVAFGKWAWANCHEPYLEFLNTLAAKEARGSRREITGLIYHERKKAA